MGWSGEWVSSGLNLKEIKYELEKGLKNWGKDYELLYYSFKFGVVYAAMKAPDGEVFAVVQLWQYSSKKGELTTKTMTDDVGPAKCEPPKKLLKLLSPARTDYAKGWRKAAWSNFKNIPAEYI